MWRTIVDVWTEAMRPESYVGQAYKAFVNQWSHSATGLAAAGIICMGWAIVFGEFPVRWHVIAGIVAFYLIVIEYIRQGWRAWDSAADGFFVGAGGAVLLASLREQRLCGELGLVPEEETAIFGFSLLLFLILTYATVVSRLRPASSRRG
jgi:hypothetical protein